MFALINSYNVSLFLHITAVVVGLGATFALAIMFPVAANLDPRHLPFVHRVSLAINKWFASPALVVILATGLYQVDKVNLSLGDFWLSATFAIVIIIGGLVGTYFIPTDRRLAEMAEREIAAAGTGELVLSEEYQRRARIEGIVGGVTGLLIVVAIWLMVTRPGM
jgi:uncharacterized membrane protein